MAVTRITVNTDKETKMAAERLFDHMGLNMTTAINIFLKKTLQCKGIPFDVRIEEPNETTINALKEGDQILLDKNRKSYKSIDELKAALDE